MGITLHRVFIMNEVKSGPRPLVLNSFHDRFQSVSGALVSHFRGSRVESASSVSSVCAYSTSDDGLETSGQRAYR